MFTRIGSSRSGPDHQALPGRFPWEPFLQQSLLPVHDEWASSSARYFSSGLLSGFAGGAVAVGLGVAVAAGV